MKILAFAASNSQASLNRSLVIHASQRLVAEFLPEAEIELLDLNDFEMPLYSIDRERADGIPAEAQRFFAAIGAADALLVSFAEHNGSYTAAFKNLYDWMSRIDKRVYQDKPTVMMATSPGGRGGANVLGTAVASARRFGAALAGHLAVPRFQKVFVEGALTDEDLSNELGRVLGKLTLLLQPASDSPGPSSAFWDERFAKSQLAYGSEPNDFLRAVAGRIPEGPVLVIAAGEGRNAVFLATLGHEVTAVDQSAVGLAHAEELAASRGVSLTTVVADLADFDMGEARWAGIVSIWTHLPPALRSDVFGRCARALKPGGAFVLEAYSPAHLDRPGKGGPPAVEMLMSPTALQEALSGMSFELFQEVQRDIQEGRDHVGPSTTVQVLSHRLS